MSSSIEAVGGTCGVQGTSRTMAHMMLEMMAQLMQSSGMPQNQETQNALQNLRNALNGNLGEASRQMAPADPMPSSGMSDPQMMGVGGPGAMQDAGGQGGVMQLLMQLLQLMMQLLSAMQQQDPAGGQGGAGGGCGEQPPFSPNDTAQAMGSAMPNPSGGPLGDAPHGNSCGGGTGGTPPMSSPSTGGVGGVPSSGGASPVMPSSGGGSSSAPAGSLSTAPQTQALKPDESKSVANQYVANLQKDFGLTKDQAKGVVANLWHESAGMNSGINQGGKIGSPSGNMADDNANGYGLAQWGGVRKQGLMDYAKQHNIDPSSQAANYGYLRQELQGPYKGVIDAVKQTKSAEEATQVFCNQFEKPSDPQMESRLQIAQQLA